MKRILSVCMVLVCVMALTACGSKTPKEPETQNDPVVVEPKETTGITFTLPEGFSEVEVEGYQQWVAADYPNDASNITLMVYEAVSIEEFASQNADNYKASVEQAMKEAGYETEVLVTNFSNYELDGYSVIRIDSTYELNGVELRQISLSINANVLYNLLFTDVADWSVDYETGIAGLQLTY